MKRRAAVGTQYAWDRYVARYPIGCSQMWLRIFGAWFNVGGAR